MSSAAHEAIPAIPLKKQPQVQEDGAAAAAGGKEGGEQGAAAAGGLGNDALTKYTTAGTLLGEVVKKLVPSIVEGKSTLALCEEGDKLIAESLAGVYNSKKTSKTPKGLAFPTCISVNNTVSHYSPLPSDGAIPELKEGDVVKVMLGVQIDGYASVHAETIVVGASADKKVSGAKADLLKAAYEAAQVAMRVIKPQARNYDVTDAVAAVASSYGCKPVEGMLSCTHSKDVTDGKKRIILNPAPEARRDHPVEVFEEGEVWGVDVLVVTGDDGKARPDASRTTVYKRASDVTYQLKMQTSRTVFSEVQKKAGAFPFTLRCLEDEKRARMGVKEAVQHGLLRPYDVVNTAAGTHVAEFFFTIALLPAGPLLLSPTPVWYSEDKINSDKSIEKEEYKELLGKKLREDKKKKKKAAGAAAEEAK